MRALYFFRLQSTGMPSAVGSQRGISMLLRRPKFKDPLRQSDLDHVIHMVEAHDPVGDLPGRLLPTKTMQFSYYAVRSFWVETGLRFGTTARIHPNSNPKQHLDWWEEGVNTIFDRNASLLAGGASYDHPTLRLIFHLLNDQDVAFTKCHFEDIIEGRRNDLDQKQYETIKSIKQHAVLSCGSLAQLVLESGGMAQSTHPSAHDAAKLMGTAHGLTNALRTSIPVLSTTGKLIIPKDLCEKYDVRSPRYLLSALGQGDAKCAEALQLAVQDIVYEARKSLADARQLRENVLKESENAVAVLLPGLASEIFLNRLEHFRFDLTDRRLRQVSVMEQIQSSIRIISSYYQRTF